VNGIIIIDKPSGWTSHDVIAKLRGALKLKRIGHGGTLDPMATGVLPVFIGRATRAAGFCENAEKEYIAGLRLGIVTDTQDITGKVLSDNEVTATREDIEAILPSFTGAIKQIPPMYSAVKKDGLKLYDLARKGIEIPREARDIFISSLSLETPETETSQHTYTLRIVCSKGTYIRTLCNDIGSALGCGATLSNLRRTRAGAFPIDEAHTLDDVLSMVLTDSVSSILLPIDSIFSAYPAISISETEEKKAKNGSLCQTKDSTTNGKYRVYTQTGEFLLLGEVFDNKITTIKNFFEVSKK